MEHRLEDHLKQLEAQAREDEEAEYLDEMPYYCLCGNLLTWQDREEGWTECKDCR